MRENAPKIVGIIRAVAKHPAQMLSTLSERNITTFLTVLRESGLKVAVSNMMRVIDNSASDIERLNVLRGAEMREFTGQVFQVPCSKNPLVSVVIPVYNQFEYTYWCVRSIVDTTKNIDYEIIIADDCSTDTTVNIHQYLPGVRVVRNHKNLRFTLNCNNAVNHAKGKYVALLNNDTIVEEGWMSSLLDVLEKDPEVGLVGSKMIYPDGVLQEAGCVVWQDGSAWNIGKGLNPNLPEFNYLKEVDYVSGASFMFPKALWDRLSGFDERYAPSYCEDSDLAFQMRYHGYKVMYQPKSEVVHFEGISNGKALKTSLKAYQLTNTRKFYEKWRDVLKENAPIGSDLFVARDRTFGKKCVVFVDESITKADGNEFDRLVAEEMFRYVEKGYSVKLIPDDYLLDDENASIYQNAGIEVLYGGEARRDRKKWARNYKGYIDRVIVCRPYLLQRYSRMFFGCDVRMIGYGDPRYENLQSKDTI